ncbi:WG repeat-containing protein [Clostridium chauvoei]|uniref:WG repeat-containing protein n=1 Tax=Clostridium chauvoei TaxID=46867 RepID=UPI001C85FEBC|nr:WG repeat-containing protein [Clostridium chauvoei]MBX7395943.1 WG repeat-containing protein [Clostridium chauvoei]
MKGIKYKHNIINLYPAIKNITSKSLYGYINNLGKFLIKPSFEYARDFNNNGVAIVVKDGLTGLIDINGDFIVDPTFSDIQEFKEGRAICIFTDGNMGVIDEAGNQITKKTYNYIGNFNNSRAVIGISGPNDTYLYGYIDLDGNEIIKPIYLNANDFSDDFSVVKLKNGKFQLIDTNGNSIASFNYKFVGSYSEGIMSFSNNAYGPYGYIDENGDILIKPKFYSADNFKDGVAIVSTSENFNGHYGVINKIGKYIYEPIYSNIKSLSEKRLALGMPLGDIKDIVNSIYALGDTDGNRLSEFIYLNIDEFDNNLASAYNYNNTFFINLRGTIVNNLPKVKGSGNLIIEDNIISAYIDYVQYYFSLSGKLIYRPNTLTILNRIYSINKLKYKPNVNYLVYYPRVNLKSNKSIENRINLKLKYLSKLKPIDKYDDLTFSYLGDFFISFFYKNLLVLKLTGYNYPLGAAHGMETLLTPSINLKTGEIYILKDLFKSSTKWINEINSIIENQIQTNSKYEFVYPNSFKGINENQDFYIDKNFLYIYFSPYEIGPYAAGFITFKIPFLEIDNFINKKGSFYKSFN